MTSKKGSAAATAPAAVEPYDSMSDPDIDINHTEDDDEKKALQKKSFPSLHEVQEKIAKLKINRSRLELRKIQIASRSLGSESKLKANEAEIMKLTFSLESLTQNAKSAA